MTKKQKHNLVNKKYRRSHKEALKKYRESINDKLKFYLKIYYLKNKLKLRIQSRKYQTVNKKRIAKLHKLYNKKHQKELKQYKVEWYQKNRERIIKQRNIYNHNKLRTDINFRILSNLRCRLHQAVKGISKTASTIKLLGCNIDLLRLHLQSKFQPGMSFSNYGKWHIDHIIPCARFDLSKKSEQKKCFHYTNLQPLWAEDNLIKGKK
jgi:hypothetical protein